MKQNKIVWLLAGVLFVFSLSSCQTTASPTATATQQALPTTGSYPASIPPANPTAGSYPVPPTVVFPTEGAYPSPQSGASTVAWTDAEQMILKGDVTHVVQSKSLDVTLTTKDGQTVTTTAPAADAVQQAITKCGALCKNVIVTNQ
jgi:hypothetical protein